MKYWLLKNLTKSSVNPIGTLPRYEWEDKVALWRRERERRNGKSETILNINAKYFEWKMKEEREGGTFQKLTSWPNPNSWAFLVSNLKAVTFNKDHGWSDYMNIPSGWDCKRRRPCFTILSGWYHSLISLNISE